jgi:indolepyruvate decarboxylase
MHHTMADGSWDHFLDAYAHVTAAHARLTPCNAATEIDRLILTAWREKLPVYMELPSDIAYLEIEVPTSPLVLAHAPSDAERLRSCIAAIAERWWTRTPTGSASHPTSRRSPRRYRLR